MDGHFFNCFCIDKDGNNFLINCCQTGSVRRPQTNNILSRIFVLKISVNHNQEYSGNDLLELRSIWGET